MTSRPAPLVHATRVRATRVRATRVRAVTLAVACAAVLATVAPSPALAELAHAELAHAELAPTPRLVNDALPARALPPTPTPDAATFCPRPTGRWWDDYAVRGCIELLTGRDHTTPLTDRELAWLDLGGLPAYATIDPEAIDDAIATYEQRLADEAAEAAAAEQAARDAAAAVRTPRAPRQPTRSAGWSDERGPRTEWDAWGECLDRVSRPSDEASLGGTEWTTYMTDVAACVDAEFPGFLARHIRERDQQQRDLQDAIARTRQQQQELRSQHNPAAVSAALDAIAAGADHVQLLLYGEIDMLQEDLTALSRAAMGVLGGSASCFSGFSKWMARELDPWSASLTCRRP